MLQGALENTTESNYYDDRSQLANSLFLEDQVIKNFDVQLQPHFMNLDKKSSKKILDDPNLSEDDQPKKVSSDFILQRISNLFFSSLISKNELNRFVDLKFMNSYTKFVNHQISQLNLTKRNKGKCNKANEHAKQCPKNEEGNEDYQKESSSHSRHTKFSKEEDEMLKLFVSKLGARNWRVISSLMPGRNQKQCRDRYMNYLAPGFVRTEWTNEEDDLLLEKYRIYGSRWSQIRQFFPNRTSNDIKNRYNYTISRKTSHFPLPETQNLRNNEVIDEIERSMQPRNQTVNMAYDIFCNADLIEINQDQFYIDNEELQINDFY